MDNLVISEDAYYLDVSKEVETPVLTSEIHTAKQESRSTTVKHQRSGFNDVQSNFAKSMNKDIFLEDQVQFIHDLIQQQTPD